MIDRGDIRQAIDRCSNIWASLPGAGYGQFEHKADSLIAKIQRSGRNGQRDWCMSRVTAIISALVICITVRLSWAVNHYRDNAITYKAQRDKNARELKLANAAITDMEMRLAMLLRLMQNTPWVNDVLKLKMMLCVMMLPLVVVGCTSKQSVSQCVKPPPPPAWIMQPPPDWQTPLNWTSHPWERGWLLAKTTGRNPEVY